MKLASVALAVVLGLSLGQPARASDPPPPTRTVRPPRPTEAATGRRSPRP